MTGPNEPEQRAALRASDDDRNRVVSLLSDALGKGQLTLGEYDERSSSAIAARTFADLDRLVEDLPSVAVAVPATPTYRPPERQDGLSRLQSNKVAVMTGIHVRGPVAVGAEHSAYAFWGGVTLDLREAQFLVQDVTINAYAIMGGISIIVPRNVAVDVDGIGFMGSFHHRNPRPGDPNGPRITVKGFGFWGGVDVISR